jgi:hypothetical protein
MQYDELISFGSQCNPGLSLRELNLKQETYPFDWVRSNAKIIYDVLKNGGDPYVRFDETGGSDEYFTKNLDAIDFKNFPLTHVNSYGQYFTHYDTEPIHSVIVKFKRYMERFFTVLNSPKRVLFIHSHEEYIYHKLSRDNKDLFYDYLCKINDTLAHDYPALQFTILNIDVNNVHEDYGNIINRSISYQLPMSDNSETHTESNFGPYRKEVTNAIWKFMCEKAR